MTVRIENDQQPEREEGGRAEWDNMEQGLTARIDKACQAEREGRGGGGGKGWLRESTLGAEQKGEMGKRQGGKW